jgi:hypothetical protein
MPTSVSPGNPKNPIMRPIGNTLNNETKRDDSVELSRFLFPGALHLSTGHGLQKDCLKSINCFVVGFS